jgi:hypothetical protein
MNFKFSDYLGLLWFIGDTHHTKLACLSDWNSFIVKCTPYLLLSSVTVNFRVGQM